MKIGFYNPYFDSLGGGERYVLTLASHWSSYHAVSLFWNDPEIIPKAQKRFNLDLTNVKVVPNFFHDEPFINKIFASSQFDLILFLSDGSIPTSCATHNILHFQIPFQKISFPFWKRIKTDAIICNSMFTRSTIDRQVGSCAEVIYPPVDIGQFYSAKKEKIILSVGRFSSLYHAKKQEVLLDIFTEGIKKSILKDWKLVLVGGLLSTDAEYFNALKSKTVGLPISLLANIPFADLQKEYAKASIYWHGAGYGETNPQLMEHFGISTVEAMASECIPIVYNGGGQPEIITHGKDGYVWNTKKECLDFTQKIIHSEKLRKELQKKAKKKVEKFSSAHFCELYDELLEKIIKR